MCHGLQHPVQKLSVEGKVPQSCNCAHVSDHILSIPNFYAPDFENMTIRQGRKSHSGRTILPSGAYHGLKRERSDHLPSTGYIQVSAYTSKGRLPLEDVAISVTASDGTAIALRLTDRNGKISLIEVPVPDLAASQRPDPGLIPYTVVNLYARKKGFEQIENENLQVFPDTVTNQNLEMIPLSELPGSWDKSEIFITPPQNL